MRSAVGVLVVVGVVFVVVQVGGLGAEGEESPLGVEQEEPFDPEGPWESPRARARVTLGVGPSVEVSTPVSVRSGDALVEEVVVTDAGGREVAWVDCRGGACVVGSPVGEREVPGVSVLPEGGGWGSGRVTGASVVAASGETVARVEAFGGQGVRVSGQAVDEEVVVSGPLVLEGDARSPSRVAVLGPGGDPVIEVDARGEGVGSVQVAGREHRVGVAHVEVMGDPLREEEVLVRVWVDGERHGWFVRATPSGAFGAAGEALEEHVVLRSPLRGEEASYRLRAGPRVIEGGGALSGRLDVFARVTVEESSGFREGWLLVDGTPVAWLQAAGSEKGLLVLEGVVPSERTDDGGSVVEARLERALAPGVVQVHHAGSVNVSFSSAGPAPPGIVSGEGGMEWVDREGVRWEAVARPVGSDEWVPVAVQGARVQAPFAPPWEWEGRVRGVDALGNVGAWSTTHAWSAGSSQNASVDPPSLMLHEPGRGERVRGVVTVAWEASGPVASVEASIRLEGQEGFETIGSAGEGAILWDSRGVPDGDHELRVTARGPGGASSVLVPVTVDNLGPVPASSPSWLAQEPRGPGASLGRGWMPGVPLPAALTAGLVLVSVAGVAAYRAGWVRIGPGGRIRRGK